MTMTQGSASEDSYGNDYNTQGSGSHYEFTKNLGYTSNRVARQTGNGNNEPLRKTGVDAYDTDYGYIDEFDYSCEHIGSSGSSDGKDDSFDQSYLCGSGDDDESTDDYDYVDEDEEEDNLGCYDYDYHMDYIDHDESDKTAIDVDSNDDNSNDYSYYDYDGL